MIEFMINGFLNLKTA